MLVGVLIGAVSGFVGGGLAGLTANALGPIASAVLGGAAGGLVGGVMNAAYFGGDIGQAALLGAGYGALGGLVFGSISQLGANAKAFNWKLGLAKIGLSAAAGGGMSELAGGEFWQGAAFAGAVASADFLYKVVTGEAPSINKATGEGEYRKEGVPAKNEGANRVGATMEMEPQGILGKSLEFVAGETGPIMEQIGKYVPLAQTTAFFHDPIAVVINKLFSIGGPIGRAVGFASLTVPTIAPSYCITVLGVALSEQPALIGMYEVYGEGLD